MNCPLCNKPLTKQSFQDSCGYEPAIYCQETISLTGDVRIFNHYREEPELGIITMYVPPYRIINDQHGSKIGFHSQYKQGRCHRTRANGKKFYYKTLIKCPLIHPDTEEKLRSRIKLLLLIS